jgi:pimeloyl-ACP methyl ester carboxylesterase
MAILVVPPLVAAVLPADERALDGVELDETTYTEVRFDNDARGIELAGMLFQPDGEGPFPAAVIIHGSGTSHRDNAWYLTVAEHLRTNGVAVLLPDKRGSEQSGGDWRAASFEDLATDTAAAVSYMRTQEELPVASVGLVGMSQGGRIAPIVASGDPDIAWTVNVAGDAVSAHQALRYEETHNLREMGVLPGVSNLLAYPSSWSLIYLRDSDFWDAVGNFDPIAYWRSVEQPALVIYGEDDTNVPTEDSVERLEALGKPNLEVRVYEGSGHAIEDPVGQGNSIFREDALDELTRFVHANA